MEYADEQLKGEKMMETNNATSTTITYGRQPYKITINLDECEGIVVIENGEEMDIREYIQRIVVKRGKWEKSPTETISVRGVMRGGQ